MSTQRNIDWQKHQLKKHRHREMLPVRTDNPEKNQPAETQIWRNVNLKKSTWRNVNLEKCQPGEMSTWRNVNLEKCQPGEMST
jgi:hypothetical protein